jgi:hypothetical protein
VYSRIKAAGCPVEFEQQVDEGLVDRSGRSQPDDRLAIRALVDAQREAREGRRVLHSGLLEGFRRSELRLQPGEFFAARKDLQLGAQGLTESQRRR